MSLERDIENFVEDYGAYVQLGISLLTLYLVWKMRK